MRSIPDSGVKNDLPAPRLAYHAGAHQTPKPGKQMGDHVHQLVDILLKQHTIKNLRKVQGIMRLGDKYGPGRLDNGLKRSLAYGKLTIKGLKHILEKSLDQLSGRGSGSARAAVPKRAQLSQAGSILCRGRRLRRCPHEHGSPPAGHS